jgi:hypothetical protein
MQPREAQTGHAINGDVTAAVLDAIRSIRFCSIEIVIHNGPRGGHRTAGKK